MHPLLAVGAGHQEPRHRLTGKEAVRLCDLQEEYL